MQRDSYSREVLPYEDQFKISSKKYSYLALTLSFPNSGAILSLGGHEKHLLCVQNKRLLLAPTYVSNKCSSPLTHCLMGGTTGSSLLQPYLAAENFYIPKGLL